MGKTAVYHAHPDWATSMTEGAPFDAGFPTARPAPARRFATLWSRQQGHLNDASPLLLAGFLSFGVLGFFALPFDPPTSMTFVAVVGSVLLSLMYFRRGRRARWLSLLPTLTVIGFAAATFQATRLGDHLLDEPVFDVAVSARVSHVIWRSDGPRFQLSEISAQDSALAHLRTVQIKWRGLEGNAGAALLGQRVEWRVTLLPVRPALVPGAFDFRRQAFFKGLSAYGYSLGPPTLVGDQRVSRTEQWRQSLRLKFQDGLTGDATGLATALVVGLRGDISEQAEANIRAAGLAHLLAISGLHVGMVTGALFFLVRLLGGLLPVVSLRLQTHRIAAIAAMAGALLYFSLSGGSVPTQRATIVVGLAMTAILLSRRPFSLRSVGFAALLVLLTQPSSLVTASFQMSFAAVIGLIVAFGFRGKGVDPGQGVLRRVLNYITSLSSSSLVATASTAIFALYHFQQVSVLGIGANLIAVPLTALWIMPLLMLAALLAPLGLELPALWLAQFGLDTLLWLSALVARIEDGIITTRDWPAVSLFCAALALWMGALLVRPLTLFALIPLAFSLLLAVRQDLPKIIADRNEGVLVYAENTPFISLGERPPGLLVVEASSYAQDQLGRFFNVSAQTCEDDFCQPTPTLFLTDRSQIAGQICQSDPANQVISLRAAPRAACTKDQARDLRSIPSLGPIALTLSPLGRVTDFQPNVATLSRFWTTNGNL